MGRALRQPVPHRARVRSRRGDRTPLVLVIARAGQRVVQLGLRVMSLRQTVLRQLSVSATILVTAVEKRMTICEHNRGKERVSAFLAAASIDLVCMTAWAGVDPPAVGFGCKPQQYSEPPEWLSAREVRTAVLAQFRIHTLNSAAAV